MAEFILACGTKVQVDAEIIPELLRHTWRLDQQGYARRKTTGGRLIRMHRVVAGAVKGQLVDHIDRDPLNNTAENLRIVTKSQNGFNQSKKSGASSKHKGVSWNKTDSIWRAQIASKEIGTKYLGSFKTEDEAAHAYNKAAILYHGEFATLNPIGEDYEATP